MLEDRNATRGETSYTLYDYKARPIRSFTQNYLGGYTQADIKLDFMGKTIFSETRHKRTANVAEILVREDFTYSAQDRLLTHTHKINNNPAQYLARHEYTELGQLKTKYTGNYNNNYDPLQKIDYRYNIRGWLTDINDVKMLEHQGEPSDLFAFKINYNTTQGDARGVMPLFNGNIAETYWRTANDGVIRKYGYVYDDLNRLRNAIYQKPDVGITNAYNENMSYDKNGNIVSLNRQGYLDSDNGQTLEIDNLRYTYKKNSNELTSVTDLSLSLDGFRDGNQQDNDYNYDANGNTTSDYNKAITFVEYNHLNLPTKINFTATKYISYLYNAQGIKVQKTIVNVDGGLKTTTDYLSGFQYKNGMLQFFPHAEGYVNVENGKSFNYVFNYSDHLGNIRLSYAEVPGTSSLKIIEENNYYPFGLKHENYNAQKYDFKQNTLGTFVVLAPTQNNDYKYKYNGKELQDDLGLNLYDYGARNYDPALGRWMNVDPLAEISRRFSPYTYALNNPVFFIDVDGMYADANGNERNDGVTRRGGHWSDRFSEQGGSTGEDSNCRSCKTKADWDAYEQQAENARKLLGSKLFEARYTTSTDEYGHDIYSLEGEEIDLVKNESLLKQGMAIMGDGLLIEAPANLFKIVSKLFGSATKGAQEGMTTVGRWMSQIEAAAMKNGLPAAVGAGNKTSVTVGGSNIWKAATKGKVYLEFQVPANSLVPGGGKGIFSILGPNASQSQMWQLTKLGGQVSPPVQNLTEILKTKK